MIKILWISRHQLTKEQMLDLKGIYGNIEILQYKKTVQAIQEIQEYIPEADIIAVVLPIDKIFELKKIAGNTPVIQSVSQRIDTGIQTISAEGSLEEQFSFKHLFWQEIVSVELVTKKLKRQ